MVVRQHAPVLAAILAACAACCALRGRSQSGRPAFIQPVSLRGPPAAARTSAVPGSLAAGPAEPGALSSGPAIPLAVLAVAAAAAALQPWRRPFAGSGTKVVAVQNACVQCDDELRTESRVAMGYVAKRPHVRIRDRSFKEKRRGHQVNKSARARFLIKPDGSVWRRQAGLRHLKSKKTPVHLKRLARMVPVKKSYHKTLWRLIHYVPPTLRASEYIMRKFNEQRLHKGEGMSDRGVGTAMWT